MFRLPATSGLFHFTLCCALLSSTLYNVSSVTNSPGEAVEGTPGD